MKKLLLLTFIFLGCESHKNEYILRCHLDDVSHVWFSKERIYFDKEAQAYYVDGNYVPPGGALCFVYYND